MTEDIFKGLAQAVWQAEVDQLVSAFLNESDEDKRDAIEWTKARFNNLEATAFVTKALLPAPVPKSKLRLDEAQARLEAVEDWQEWLAGAVAEVLADPSLRDGLRKEADRWGPGAGEEFILALAASSPGLRSASSSSSPSAPTTLPPPDPVEASLGQGPASLAPTGTALAVRVETLPASPSAQAGLPVVFQVDGPGAEDENETRRKAGKPALLNPKNPLEMAKEFMRRYSVDEDGFPIVRHWQGQYYRWNGTAYSTVEDEVFEQHVLSFLASSLQRVPSVAQPVQFVPLPKNVSDVMFNLRPCLKLPAEHVPPMWLDTGLPAKEMIVFRNGIVNVFTGEMLPLTHHFWAHSALKFDWDPAQACPVWERFLGEVFPNDPEACGTLEEMMGYCMTEETRFQKGGMLIGKSRSGKGTIARMLLQLVGPEASVSLSIHTWLKGEHSAQSLIGKRVGVFPDWRGKPGKRFGANYDPGGLEPASREMLLKITGEDDVTIPRKYIGAWHGKLPLKTVIASNKIPNLNDPTLNTRYIKFRFNVSFKDREDTELLSKLVAELPGIAARCIAAYQRLCRRGRFIQPTSGLALDREILAASDAVAAMAMDCFVLDPNGTTTKASAYSRFTAWCGENQRGDIKVQDNQFGKLLRTVAGFENIKWTRPLDLATGKQGPRVWHGFTLRNRTEEQ